MDSSSIKYLLPFNNSPKLLKNIDWPEVTGYSTGCIVWVSKNSSFKVNLYNIEAVHLVQIASLQKRLIMTTVVNKSLVSVQRTKKQVFPLKNQFDRKPTPS